MLFCVLIAKYYQTKILENVNRDKEKNKHKSYGKILMYLWVLIGEGHSNGFEMSIKDGWLPSLFVSCATDSVFYLVFVQGHEKNK